jgi:ATP-binding cassette subfamily B protein
MIDGIDVRDVTQHDLREKIGYVPQKGTLFTGTIESNLRYADENANEARLNEAIDVAQARHFVDNRSDGLASDIAQGGSNVSGGQKQRLSIARALVSKPPIYIFDDTFSALDFKTDAALRRALNATILDSAVLVVTQRVSTVRKAEQIIVLDQGKVVGKGTHEHLMADCETYREIATSQLSLEELL